MDTATLQAAISEVCPVETVTVSHSTDRLQWRYVAKPEATPEQIYSADVVIVSIPIYPNVAVSTADWLARWTNAEYRALQDRRMTDNGNLGKSFDITISGSSVDFNRKRTQSLKADLVAAGILTQARADAIFA
jgi:hypothetical protein